MHIVRVDRSLRHCIGFRIFSVLCVSRMTVRRPKANHLETAYRRVMSMNKPVRVNEQTSTGNLIIIFREGRFCMFSVTLNGKAIVTKRPRRINHRYVDELHPRTRALE
jgi:hypothetical protein